MITPNKTPKISFLFVIFIKVFSFQNLVHKPLYLSDFSLRFTITLNN